MCCEFCSVLPGSVEASSLGPMSIQLGDNGEAAKGHPKHQDWESNKNFIWDLYISKGATLKEVQAALRSKGFNATYVTTPSLLRSLLIR